MKPLHITFILTLLLIPLFEIAAQTDPPWDRDPDCNSITADAIVAFTCGASDSNPADQQFTLGMAKIDGLIPPLGRVDVSDDVDMYHHPSWHIDVIGNVFGVVIDNCGDTYVTASSNYPSHFFQAPSTLKYGSLAGTPLSLESAGAIYKISAETGEATHFTSLPQLQTKVTNNTCEPFGGPLTRFTGPGLGNITWHPDNNQFYVTNFEDGRIYRLDIDGEILDSYDPLSYDNGLAGVFDYLNVAYGLTISPGGDKLFFGTVGEYDFTTQEAGLYSINLNADGGFEGSINNTTLPAGATWDNYVGNDTLHHEINFPGFLLFGRLLFVADLEFLPNGELFLGIRSGCGNDLFNADNHDGHSLVLSQDAGSGLFEIEEGIVISSNGLYDAYGGVTYYEYQNGDVEYILTSSDMLGNSGPHGLHISEEDNFQSQFGGQVTPAAIISYGGISDNLDVKGIGGDAYVFKMCDCGCLCKGDINRDGFIDLLDVQPFVDLIISGKFDDCGDINMDGFVNLLDVDPFVQLLTSGATCGNGRSANSEPMDLNNYDLVKKIYQQLETTSQPGIATELSLYPNPAKDQLSLEFIATLSENVVIEIFDIQGRLVFEKSVSSYIGRNKVELNLSKLETGLYLVKVMQEGIAQHKKLMIAK